MMEISDTGKRTMEYGGPGWWLFLYISLYFLHSFQYTAIIPITIQQSVTLTFFLPLLQLENISYPRVIQYYAFFYPKHRSHRAFPYRILHCLPTSPKTRGSRGSHGTAIALPGDACLVNIVGYLIAVSQMLRAPVNVFRRSMY
jgi:hypothetical protein